MNNPLHNKRILITRPGEGGKALAAMLENAGAQTIIMPMIEIAEPDSWQELDDAIKNIDSYHWLFFASSNAVSSFCNRADKSASYNVGYRIGILRSRGRFIDPSNAKLPKIAVIGEATANSAKQQGLKIDYCPDIYLAENFVDQFPDYANLSGKRILWPRTNIGRDLITKKLQASGAIVHEVPAYKTTLPQNAKDLSAQLNKMIAEKKIDVITLASTETAKNLGQIISLNLGEKTPAQLAIILKGILLVTIGPQTAEGALNYLGMESIKANPHTNEGMLSVLTEYYRTCKTGS